MYDRMIAGPANCAAAAPVSTKMPAPMIAPIPSVMRLVAPKARFRPCSSPDSASFTRASSDFVAIRLAIQFGSPTKRDGSRSGRGARDQPRPQEIHRDADQYDDQSRPGVLGL